jgi:Holliday junction resolvase RusA-like endonuclease
VYSVRNGGLYGQVWRTSIAGACVKYDVNPVAKPRMTQRDRWAKRSIVLKYRAFCDECRLKMTDVTLDGARVIFHVPMPQSWSKKKKVRMNTRPHRQRPDLDNFMKALGDALMDEDSGIADMCLSKRWALSGAIEIHQEHVCL